MVKSGKTLDIEWYRKYDARSEKYIGKSPARDKKVLIISTDSLTYEGQLMTIVVSNLISRFCSNIVVMCENVVVHHLLRCFDTNSLIKEIKETMLSANYRGNYDVILPNKIDIDNFDYILKVGSGESNLPVNFTIDGTGWQVFLGKGNCNFKALNESVINPTGPGAAACFGATNCFKTLNGFECDEQDITFSMFNYSIGINNPPTPEFVELGIIQLIGLGMMGSSIAYFIKKFSFNFKIILVDHDIVKIENLSRSPLFRCNDIDVNKALTVANYLGHSVLDCHQNRYDEIISKINRRLYADIVIPVANEHGIRRQVQANYPPFMIYASTDRNWGVELGRYVPGKTDCLACRYEEQSDLLKTSCSKGEIVTKDGTKEDISLPFLAPLGGLMVIGEFIKLGMDGYPFVKNRVLINTLGSLYYPIQYDKNACNCVLYPNLEVNKQLNSKTKYYRLLCDN